MSAKRRDLGELASEYLGLSGLWETGFSVETRKARTGKEYTEADVRLILDAHREAFDRYALEHLEPAEAQVWRDHEGPMSVEQLAALYGTTPRTIQRQRKRIMPKVRKLWGRWPYSGWWNGPDASPFLYERARRHDDVT